MKKTVIAGIVMLGAWPLFAATIPAADNAYVRDNSGTVQDDSDVIKVKNEWGNNYARISYVRFPLNGSGAIGGIASHDIASVSLGVDIRQHDGDRDHVLQVYALADGADYDTVEGDPDDDWLSETEWTGSAGSNPLVDTNLPHGDLDVPGNALTTPMLGSLSFWAADGDDFKVGVNQIELSLPDFKTLIDNDTNGEITLILRQAFTGGEETGIASLGNSGGFAGPALTVQGFAGYDAWAAGRGAEIGASTNDFDSDGLNNLYEYGLDGDPTNALDQGVLPVFLKTGGFFTYVHPMRSDTTNITYRVETTTNLVSGTWTNRGYVITGIDVTGGTLDFVTNRIETADGTKFVRLRIAPGAPAAAPSEKSYFINTQNDFDQWSNFEFPAGSKVLFAAGETFTGQFVLRGSGTAAFPNLAAAYDRDTGEVLTEWTDDKPVIHGEGLVQSALKLVNGSFWEINNIEVTNTDGTPGEQGEILGINVTATDIGTAEEITVKNCYVHDVNGDVGGKYTGGIHVYVLGSSVPTVFRNVTIESNLVSYVGGVGIANQSSYGKIYEDDFHPWTGYVVRGNRVEYTGRNGIIVRYSIDPLVEYNVAAYNSRFDVGHSIFNFNTDGCIVQYNEAYGNTSDDPGEIDRGGFDCDFNSKNTIYQYNYSHDNHWFIAIQRKYNHGVIIRYNISQNERLGAYMFGFPEYDDLENCEIYNNTHYFGSGAGTNLFIEAGKDRIPTQTKFMNNILYFEDAAQWGFDPDSTCVLSNNVYVNLSPKGANAVTADPLFVSPGTGGTDIDMADPDRLPGYRLQPGSPALGAGVLIENNGGKNFSGEELSGDAVNIGAF